MTESPNRTAIQVPDSVTADDRAIELVRLWWSNDEPVMAIKPAFDDPKAYGHMLAIAARNVAHVYNQAKGLDEAETYKLVLAGLNEGLAKAAGSKPASPQ
ncbi:DUF5076 domain-containing protein [Brevundimonas aurifodinae]|jgi:hypothetical protein|uniref:DUF5076 domain-containing protein n=2 Tax=Brevundimonas TaxID=41275 RepID=A0ABV1NKR3_9CAUL|nr:MAG: hypothetical protein B7Z42_08825 [Brevundimonas sp. 12-68-7]OYX34579.1 MAG: hypothetical protein B7Z01_05295 [Brevundimonas subvibrioides]